MSSSIDLQGRLVAQARWLNSDLGQHLQKAEQSLFDLAVVDLFGFNAVQMGAVSMNLLRQSRIAHRFFSSELYLFPQCADQFVDQSYDLCCKDDFLPFESASLDLLLLPHRLEFSDHPHQTLREAERVLVPEGHLLISGFNPFSSWGVTSRIKHLFCATDECAHFFPWNGRFISLARLKDWLSLLGFEVVTTEMCCHVPPFEQDAWYRRFSFMEKMGANWLPMMGGVYFIVAKKRVAGMTLLKPNWKSAPLKSSLAIRPTQQTPSQNEGLMQQDKQRDKQ
ncbi:MAG: class I SAM-dependent methyltransferase [Betaproteobacteria bacterium]|nr:class I SAM-dependent methyltransferase [Betaproteobacteria bacterium]